MDEIKGLVDSLDIVKLTEEVVRMREQMLIQDILDIAENYYKNYKEYHSFVSSYNEKANELNKDTRRNCLYCYPKRTLISDTLFNDIIKMGKERGLGK